MGAFSMGHLLVILLVVVIVFGVGKLPRAMGDLSKGVKAFRDGLKDENEKSPENKTIAANKEQE